MAEVRNQGWPPGSTHACACMWVHACVYVCVCEWEREREGAHNGTGTSFSLPQGLIRTADSSSSSHCLTLNKCPQLSRTLFVFHGSNFMGIPLLVSLLLGSHPSLMPSQIPASSRKVSLAAQSFSARAPSCPHAIMAGPHMLLLLFSPQCLHVAEPQQVLGK